MLYVYDSGLESRDCVMARVGLLRDSAVVEW